MDQDVNLKGNEYNLLVTCLASELIPQFFFSKPLANDDIVGCKWTMECLSELLILYLLDIIGQVPHALIIQKVAPRIWFPLMTLVWAALTMLCGACHTFSQLAAVRFFQGVAEASTYSGTQYIIGSWYKGPEVGKRVGLFQASGMVGTMFAGNVLISCLLIQPLTC